MCKRPWQFCRKTKLFNLSNLHIDLVVLNKVLNC